MTLHVAVCASSAEPERERARSVAERLTAAGCEVTSDWWLHHPATRGSTDAECTRLERLAGSAACTRALILADIVLVLGSDHKSEGRAYELAWARFHGMHVVIVGKIPSAFGEPTPGERHFDTDEQAIAYLAQRAQRGAW